MVESQPPRQKLFCPSVSRNVLLMQSPHAPTVNLRIEDFIFGSVRLASRKYQKQSDNVLRFDRLIKKHFLPLALTNTPDVLSEVGLGNIDDALSYQQQRAVLKLFMKFSGQDVPEEAMRGAGFIQAIKSLNMPPPSSSEEHLLALLEEGCKLDSRPLKPNENLSGEAAMDREVSLHVWSLQRASSYIHMHLQ